MSFSLCTAPRRLAILGAAAAAALILGGCSTFPNFENGAKAVPLTAADAAKKKKEEAKPRPFPMPTMDALRKDGIYYVNDNQGSRFWITDAIAKDGLFPVKEEFTKGSPHGFTWGSGAASILRNGLQVEPRGAVGVEEAKDHHAVIHFKDANGKPTRLNVKLQAYDMSGLPIGHYLRTHANRSTPAGFIIGAKYSFPKGSVGYRATMWIDQDEVLIPTKTAFTGSSTIEDLSKRFSKQIPYCLRYIPGKRAEPAGFLFEKPIEKKTAVVKGRRVEQKQSGEVELFRVKKGTIFCAKDDEKSRRIGEAEWTLRYVNGTRVIEFEFPNSISPENYGMLRAHKDALRVAFAEETTKVRGRSAKRLLPARIWLAGTEIEDYQWRFNKTAAEAIYDAIKQTKSERAAWDAKHKTRR